MPCSHASNSGDKDGVDRREFVKAAVAIGGMSALSACVSRVSDPPQGTTDSSVLPERQFAWMDFSRVSESTGEAQTPTHHIQLLLDYTSEGEPTESDREAVETALQTLERAYEWSDEGLIFTIGYSQSYFDRFDESLPEGTGLERPEKIIEEADIQRGGEIKVDDADAHLHLASHNPTAVLEAEEALKGNRDSVNGVPVEESFDGIFSVVDRRTGFSSNQPEFADAANDIDEVSPHDEWDQNIDEENPVGEDAPVFFGFKSLFRDSQPTEDHVAIKDEDHPFYNGTTEQVSLIRDTDIDEWYERNDHEKRAQLMYSPEHTELDTGQHGRDLAPDSGTKEFDGGDGKSMSEIAEQTAADAEEKGFVGHAQKIARARDPAPPLLRRDFPSTDGGEPRLQFISHQRDIEDFIEVRKWMSFINPDDDVAAEEELDLRDHGLLGYMQVERRGAFLLPPRDLRALPPARP